MNRSEVWWVEFDPTIGEEINKLRPAVIVSNDATNRRTNRVQVVPLSRNISRIYQHEALITFNGRQVKAMADQLRTVSVQRVINRQGIASNEAMSEIEDALRYQLVLPERRSESAPL